MKVSGLLTQYLYQNKVLNIPGIGRFSIDKEVTVPEQSDKNFQEFLQYIQFTPNPAVSRDNGLIDYIRLKTGKIKPLAEADLESYLSDCKLLLNIGKPLYLEGIGTLQKNKDGGFDFLHGQAMSERMESSPMEKGSEKQGERRFLYNNEYTSQSGQTNILRKTLMFVGIVIGLGVVIWGGYLLYSKNINGSSENNESSNPPVTDNPKSVPQVPDSMAQKKAMDTSAIETKIPDPHQAKNTYKFICEETLTRQRALSRFQALKQLSNQYRMETRDSVHFTIYVILPSSPSDTTWKKDSLKAWYWGTRNRTIKIQQSN